MKGTITCMAICFLAAMITIGCEKVITAEIPSAPKRLVVEGIITDDSVCKVRISQISNFYDTANLEGITGATVSISDNGSFPTLLKETNARGIYRANLLGKPGHRYSLRIVIDSLTLARSNNLSGFSNQTYQAVSAMPAKVRMDSLFVTKRKFLGKERMFATVKFKDPQPAGNAYRFVQYVNGFEETSIFILNDALINNRQVLYDLQVQDIDYSLEKCDQLRVSMQCVEKPVYLYWYSLSQGAMGSTQAASPNNPVSNITGGAIGYFSAYAVSTMNIAVFPDSTCSYPANK
ncbi:MAG: DUF4249 domain-containing protein [Niabella sp.]|nr:MAG: DUF4249 domain-containing protein [Niabella sp.]